MPTNSKTPDIDPGMTSFSRGKETVLKCWYSAKTPNAVLMNSWMDMLQPHANAPLGYHVPSI